MPKDKISSLSKIWVSIQSFLFEKGNSEKETPFQFQLKPLFGFDAIQIKPQFFFRSEFQQWQSW